VGYAAIVASEFDLSELWNRESQRMEDAPQPSRASPFLGLGNGFEKVASERIVRPPYGAVWLPNELWNDVQVTDRFKERYEFSKRSILIDLLQMGLSKTLRVVFVLCIRPFEENLSIPNYLFFSDRRLALLILVENQFILPARRRGSGLNGRPNPNVRVAPSRQAPERTDAPAAADRLLKAAAGGGEITQEAEGVEQVGFSRGVGTDEKRPLLKRYFNLSKVLPVLKAYT